MIDLKQEYKRCSQDPLYFINNYCSIPNSNIPFHTFNYQENLIHNFQVNRCNLVVHARQVGISTLLTGYVVWFILFKEKCKCMVKSHNRSATYFMLANIKRMYYQLPDWLKVGIVRNTEEQFHLLNESEVYVFDTMRYMAYLDLIVIENVIQIKDIEEVLNSININFYRKDSRCIVTSTAGPKKKGCWFYETYKNSKLFVPTKVLWYEHQEHDENYFNNMTYYMTQQQIYNEFLCQFT